MVDATDRQQPSPSAALVCRNRIDGARRGAISTSYLCQSAFSHRAGSQGICGRVSRIQWWARNTQLAGDTCRWVMCAEQIILSVVGSVWRAWHARSSWELTIRREEWFWITLVRRA